MKLVKDTDAKVLKTNNVSDQDAEEAFKTILNNDIDENFKKIIWGTCGIDSEYVLENFKNTIFHSIFSFDFF